MMFKKAGLWRGLTFVFAFVLCFAIAVGTILEQFRSTVDSALKTQSDKMVTSNDDDTLWKSFTPPDDVLTNGKGDSNKLIKKSIDIGRRQGAEGSVLLKNQSNVLPLSTGSKVTLLGMHSHAMFLGASMGVTVKGPIISLEDALSASKTDFNNAANQANGVEKSPFTTLDDYDIESAGYTLNKTMIDIYDKLNPWVTTRYGKARKFTAAAPSIPRLNAPDYDPEEPSLTDIAGINPDYASSFAGFSDAAIVVVGRPSGESNDYLPGAVKESMGADEPLALSADERAIIKLATDNFKKVIVLINTSSSMEIDDLKHNDKIQSIMWVGQPGAYGTLGIADILCGRVSPSGGLPDVYAAKNLSHPAMMNMGDITLANASEITRAIGRSGSKGKYVVEAEGIYVGYRYFETRYYDAVNNKGNAKSAIGKVASKGANWSYAEEMSYGFGYGLSYTSFKQEFVGKPVVKKSAHDFTVDFDVKVTNTGAKKGKSIVQMYGQAPYVVGGVEKSAIQLIAFDKTKELAPNESQTLTIHVDMQDLASYNTEIINNAGGKGSYILDSGKYNFTIGNGAHDAVNNILAKDGKKIADGMDYDGNAANVYAYDYAYDGIDKTTFAVSKANVAISNQLPYSDWNSYAGASKVTYLSRSDWAGTYPKNYSNLTASAALLNDLNGKYYEIKTNDDTANIKFGDSSVAVTFADMKGADFNDPRWEQLMNKITLEEAMGVIACNGNQFRKMDSIGFAPTSAKLTENAGNGVAYALGTNRLDDAPWAFAKDDKNAGYQFGVFACGPTVAASFNPELFKESGEIVGLQALFVGLPILWGPGLNTHRSPYNGRNGEYYSEDPILCGNICMEYSIGALEYGLIAAPKHFAFNDQETNRNGIAPFMTEQRAREIELRAFQIAVESTKYDTATKDVGMLGLMDSFSKIGGVECTASYGLMTGILKNEWGFKGYSVTDISDDFDIYTAVAHSGITGYDVRAGYKDSGFEKYKSMADDVVPSPELYAKDASMLLAFKDAAKNVLWAFSQSNFMNNYNNSTHTVWQMTWWRGVYISMIVVFSVLVVGAATMYVLSVIKNKKKEATK